jgi:mannan endo-1,4-beta-mannosidase
MWIRWKHHPYNKAQGGPCSKRSQWLLCPDTLKAIKARFTFAVERWGGSGALFAWDLWNEIHPAHAGNSTDVFYRFVSELSSHVRELETRHFGRAHLQTVSLFGPVLQEHPAVADVIFRHPLLDFATTHFYDAKTINHPKNTVAPAVCAGALVREAIEHIQKSRPFFDSEHGPIHALKICTVLYPNLLMMSISGIFNGRIWLPAGREGVCGGLTGTRMYLLRVCG